MRVCLAWLLGALLALPAADAWKQQLSKDDRITHALDRLAFGPRPGDVERLKRTGLERWIDEQLHPERIPEDPRLETVLARFETLGMTPAELVEHYPPPQLLKAMAEGRVPLPADPQKRAAAELLIQRYKSKGDNKPANRANFLELLTPEQRRTLRRGTPEEREEIRRQVTKMVAPQRAIHDEISQAKLYRAIHSSRQLQEVLADFWFNHFNVFIDKGANRYLVTSYERDAIRPHVLGKFQDMVLATARHPAMLFYLDNWQSMDPSLTARARGKRRLGLNENYGRELLELHTLGVDGGYTQQDVTEVARAFTGWTIRDPRRGGGFEFNPRMHDKGEKTVLGVKIPAGGGMEDGMKVIEMVSRHPSTARFVGRKLAQRFVADEPPDALVERMARSFLKTGGDLREVMKTMLDSKEFWSKGAWRAKVKTPLEMVASAARATGADVRSASALVAQVAELGQPLYRKQEPTGYSSLNEEWVNSAALLARMNFAVALADNRIAGVRLESSPELGVKLGSPEFQRR
jgi:uncharacterized protein (DUF1800 family)